MKLNPSPDTQKTDLPIPILISFMSNVPIFQLGTEYTIFSLFIAIFLSLWKRLEKGSNKPKRCQKIWMIMLLEKIVLFLLNLYTILYYIYTTQWPDEVTLLWG